MLVNNLVQCSTYSKSSISTSVLFIPEVLNSGCTVESPGKFLLHCNVCVPPKTN